VCLPSAGTWQSTDNGKRSIRARHGLGMYGIRFPYCRLVSLDDALAVNLLKIADGRGYAIYMMT